MFSKFLLGTILFSIQGTLFFQVEAITEAANAATSAIAIASKTLTILVFVFCDTEYFYNKLILPNLSLQSKSIGKYYVTNRKLT